MLLDLAGIAFFGGVAIYTSVFMARLLGRALTDWWEFVRRPARPRPPAVEPNHFPHVHAAKGGDFVDWNFPTPRTPREPAHTSQMAAGSDVERLAA